MESSPNRLPTASSAYDPRLADLPPPVRLVCLPRGAEGREQAEVYVRSAFARRYRAQVHGLPDCLMGLYRADGTLTAVAGLRVASETPLFLEQYLDAPIEHYLLSGGPTERSAIVEIGSLAAPTPGQVRYLMIALATYLHSAGYHWVVCTAITSLRNTLSRMGLTPVSLGTADPARLVAAADDWGRYYEEHPRVIAGHLAEAAALLESRAAYPDNPVHELWRCARDLGRRNRIAAAVGCNTEFATGICA